VRLPTHHVRKYVHNHTIAVRTKSVYSTPAPYLTSNNIDYYFTLPAHLNFTKNIQQGSKVIFISIEQESGKTKAKIIKIIN
jgi:hypothetical protein